MLEARFLLESRMREICTSGSTRGGARLVPSYSTGSVADFLHLLTLAAPIRHDFAIGKDAA